MPTRTFVVAAAVVGAAALATTSITYASISDSSESSTSGHRAAAPAQPSAPSTQRPTPASPPLGDGAAHGRRNDHQQQGHDPQGGSQQGRGQQGRGQEKSSQEKSSQEGRGQGRDGNDRDGGHGDERGRGGGYGNRGRIYFNDRTYSAHTDGCVTVASGLGSSSFSVYNDSRVIIEVFRGFTCDNGAPVATVGPHGTGYGVVTRTVHGGVFGDDGVVGSFRVIHHDEW